MPKKNRTEEEKSSSNRPSCAKCGACTSVCPVYKVTGRESLSARGKIHLFSKQTNLQKADGLLPELFSKCLLCGACTDICPRGINIRDLVLEARETMPEMSGMPGLKKFLCRQLLNSPKLLYTLGVTSRSLQTIEKILPPASGLRLRLGLSPSTNSNNHQYSADIVTIQQNAQNAPNHRTVRFRCAAYSFMQAFAAYFRIQKGRNGRRWGTSEWLPDVKHYQDNKTTAKVLYFSGCMATYLDHEIRDSSLKLLNSLCQMPAAMIKGQNCCGMAALASGNRQQAKKLAINNIKSFSVDAYCRLPIFTSCATCYSQLKSYRQLLADDPDWAGPAVEFSSRVWEFSTFILQYGINIKTSFREKEHRQTVVYHDPCHLRFKDNEDSTALLAPPRQLLNFIPGLRLEEFPHGPQCCGQGGLFNIAHPDLSQQIGHNIQVELDESTASTVTTTCTGCLNQWHFLLQRGDAAKSAQHLAVLLAEHLRE